MACESVFFCINLMTVKDAEMQNCWKWQCDQDTRWQILLKATAAHKSWHTRSKKPFRTMPIYSLSCVNSFTDRFDFQQNCVIAGNDPCQAFCNARFKDFHSVIQTCMNLIKTCKHLHFLFPTLISVWAMKKCHNKQPHFDCHEWCFHQQESGLSLRANVGYFVWCKA